MLYVYGERIFQQLFAGGYFLPRKLQRHLGEEGVGQRMGADLMACRQPFPYLRFVHQSLRSFATWQIPEILPAHLAGHDELNRPKIILAKRLETIFQDVGESIIKRDDDSPTRFNDLSPFDCVIERFGFPARSFQLAHLSSKKLAAEIKTLESRSTRTPSDFVIRQNR